MQKSEFERKEQAAALLESSTLSDYIKTIFESFKTARRPFEEIWEECWYNFLGQYQANTVWRKETEGTGNRSKVFIKLTTLKCHTAHSKIMDVFSRAEGDVPFDAIPVYPEMMGLTPEQAKELAERFKGKLKDHFRYIELGEKMDVAILECAILGTAVLKGPIVERRERPHVQMRQIAGMPVNQIASDINPYELTTIVETVPTIDHIPLWEYYVDPNARSRADSIGEIHFQRLLPAHFKKLAYQGGYNREAVMLAAARVSERSEDEDGRIRQLGDNYMGEQGKKDERISALEYQGLVPVHLLEEAKVQIPNGVHEHDSIEAYAVLGADGIVVKACVNPIGRRQFHVCPYKKRPHVIYGQGVAEAMRDSQKMINSGARLYVDNKALSGNGMVAINLDRINTKKTKNLKIYPGKTIYTKGGIKPKDAVDSIEFKDVTSGIRELMEMFERFADEETGVPKYTHGEQGSFLNKTATGMSMLMTAANINLKSVMRNIDTFFIEPIVESFHQWFMMFDQDQGMKIPLKIKAEGTDSLMAKEIKLENIMRFMQICSQPQDAIFQDRVKLMKMISRLLETGDIMRSDEEIAQIMEEMNKRGGQGKDLRESVKIERLYPFLARSEQTQILQLMGIQPEQDPNLVPEPDEQDAPHLDTSNQKGVPALIRGS